MAEEGKKSSGCLWIVIAGVLVLLVPFVLVGKTLVARSLADWDIQPLCKAEGGIRVFEVVQLGPGESLIPGPINWSAYDDGRAVGKSFRLKKTHVFMRKYGVAVYRYTAWIERNTDKKRLSEMTWYFREGDEAFHGKHCPDNPSEEELIKKTFSTSAPNPPLNTDAPRSGAPVS